MNDQLDPRIHRELEKLNEASKVINQLENKLNDTRNEYRSALSESTQQLNQLHKKLGDCVAKARPFYDAKQVAKAAQLETQLAAVRFERAVSMHAAAREMVAVAEQGMEKGMEVVDTAWQEMLNHATIKVNEAEDERLVSEEEHQRTMEVFKNAEANVNSFQRKLRFNVMKSRKYFELKDQTQNRIQALVDAVNSAEEKLLKAKADYSQALKNLESISESIHEARKYARETLGERGAGVGAEEEPITEDEARPPFEEISLDEDDELAGFKQDLTSENFHSHTSLKLKHHDKNANTHSMPVKNSEILLSVADLSSAIVS